MNWNAVIKSLQEEASRCARRASTSCNPEPYKTNELLKMEIYIDFAKALAEGLRPEPIHPQQKSINDRFNNAM